MVSGADLIFQCVWRIEPITIAPPALLFQQRQHHITYHCTIFPRKTEQAAAWLSGADTRSVGGTTHDVFLAIVVRGGGVADHALEPD